MHAFHCSIYTTIAAVCKFVFTLPSSRFDENLPERSQFYSDHHQNRRLSSHSYSHESVIFSYFLDSYFLNYGEFAFFEFKCMRLRCCSRCKQSTAGQSIILREGTAGCAVASATRLWDAESIIFNRGRSVASRTIHG